MATPKLRLVTTSEKLSTAEYKTLQMSKYMPNLGYIFTDTRIIMPSETYGSPAIGQKISCKTHKRNLFVHAYLPTVTTEQKKETVDFAAASKTTRYLYE